MHRARKDGALDIASDHRQHLRIGLMGHTADVLLDDEAFIEGLSRVMRCGSDQLDAPRVRAFGSAPANAAGRSGEC